MLSSAVQIHRTFTGNYDQDKSILIEIAESPMTAANAFQHAQVVMGLFNRLTYGTPSAPNYPERSGLVRKVFDELFPIAHFAKLYFDESDEVSIRWHHGNQNFDAIVEDRRQDSSRSSIRHLEVTTLQNRQDADLLTQLANERTVCIEGDHGVSDHLRKAELLRVIIEKKGQKKYPPNTALLVYTDEDRFAHFSSGTPAPKIDKKNSFGDVVKEMQHLLTSFSEVYVYSKNEIYCSVSI